LSRFKIAEKAVASSAWTAFFGESANQSFVIEISYKVNAVLAKTYAAIASKATCTRR
jgi:hypothetical protein